MRGENLKALRARATQTDGRLTAKKSVEVTTT